MAINSEGTIEVLADGTVPISLSCLVAVTCRGALIVGSFPSIDARSDLVVGPGETVVLGVGLSEDALELVRSSGPVDASVFAISELTERCAQVVERESECTEFLPPPEVDPSTGEMISDPSRTAYDGITYLSEGRVMLVAE
jgi:hypothetical protein